MNNKDKTTLRIFTVVAFVLIILGLVLCVNYFFVPGIGIANIVANAILTLTFLIALWYLLMGYKIPSDKAFGVPLFMYAICVIAMISASSVSIATATPFIIASTSTIIIYCMVIAFNQKNVKLCTILFALILVSELGDGFFTMFLHSDSGVLAGGSVTATMNNIHIFVRSFMTTVFALCYFARRIRAKYE